MGLDGLNVVLVIEVRDLGTVVVNVENELSKFDDVLNGVFDVVDEFYDGVFPNSF